MNFTMTLPRLGIQIDRLGTTLLALTLCVVMVATGCWFNPAWISKALADLPVLVAMAQQIVTLLAVVRTQSPPSQAEIDAINSISTTATNGLKAIQKVYDDYSSANAQATKDQIMALGNALVANLAQLLAAAHIKDLALSNAVSSAVAIIVSTVNMFLTMIPQLASATKKQAKTLAANLPSPDQLREQWRSQVGVPLLVH